MAHDTCTLIIETHKRDVFADGHMPMDETPVNYQAPKRNGISGTGYLTDLCKRLPTETNQTVHRSHTPSLVNRLSRPAPSNGQKL